MTSGAYLSPWAYPASAALADAGAAADALAGAGEARRVAAGVPVAAAAVRVAAPARVFVPDPGAAARAAVAFVGGVVRPRAVGPPAGVPAPVVAPLAAAPDLVGAACYPILADAASPAADCLAAADSPAVLTPADHFADSQADLAAGLPEADLVAHSAQCSAAQAGSPAAQKTDDRSARCPAEHCCSGAQLQADSYSAVHCSAEYWPVAAPVDLRSAAPADGSQHPAESGQDALAELPSRA